jgi:hypothetical protein
MAALIATPGDPLANSYTTVETASALLEQRLGMDAWEEANADEQMAALLWATSLLDTQVHWFGVPTFATQALAWPQTGQVDRWGRALDTLSVPMQVQQATALYAVTLLRVSAPGVDTSTSDLVVKSKKIGDTTITYQDISGATARAPVSPYAIPTEVQALLRAYGLVPGGCMAHLLRA